MDTDPQPIEEGQNDKFLSKNHQPYDEDNNVSQDKDLSDTFNQSLQHHLQQMETGVIRNDDDEVERKPRNGRGNRNTPKQEQEAEVKPKGRGNRGDPAQNQEQKPSGSPIINTDQKLEDSKEGNQSEWDDSKQEHGQEGEIQKDVEEESKPILQGSDKKSEHSDDDKKPVDGSNWEDDENDSKKEPVQEQKNTSPTQGRSGRSRQPPKKVQEPQKKESALDQSNWQQEAKNEDQKKKSGQRNGRSNQPQPQSKNGKQEDENELEPDKVNGSSWDNEVQQKPQQVPSDPPAGNRRRGNRDTNDSQKPEQQNLNTGFQPRRGNREYNNNNQEGGNSYNNRGYNNYRGQGRQRGGERGGCRGRGGFGGGFRGNQNQEDGGHGGNRFGGNNYNRNFNNNNSESQPNFMKKDGFRNHQNSWNNNNDPNSRDQRNQAFDSNGANNGSNQSASSTSSIVKTLSPVYDAVQLIEPKGLESWPEVSLYVKKCKVSLTFRAIKQHQADALVFPIEDMNFKLHPSVLINADVKYNYRQKIKQKFDKSYWDKSSVYRKPCHGMGSFKDVYFCKVDTSKETADYRQMVKELIEFSMLEPKSETLVFPVCKQLKDFNSLLATWIDCLIVMAQHQKTHLKRLEFSTKDPQCFVNNSTLFLAKMAEDMASNKIFID